VRTVTATSAVVDVQLGAGVAALPPDAEALPLSRTNRRRPVAVDGAGPAVELVTAELQASTAKLRESEQRRSLALAAGGMGSWDCDLATGDWLWDEGQCRICGVDPAGFVPTSERIARLLHP